MNSTILQSDLYLNPDPLVRLIGEPNGLLPVTALETILVVQVEYTTAQEISGLKMTQVQHLHFHN